ncbi:MAG: tRNA lysidine(34) synthetase TilS [Gammaproteobacteria bacterium SHHR-1]|uniref:tRNA lysidine(34) synthetase TilS n=1 Tax=Magnetovirga frankeli TaxID=947516 RepID=UPI001293DE70|nr:tRNA lysidine(34) synthetase TilS [gamma proteobacterium SS-5]
MCPLLDALRPRLRQLPPAQRYLIALSGGADSLALLHGLWELRDEFAPSLQAIHVDHGLQAQSGHWADWCQQHCAELGLDCIGLRLELPAQSAEGLEASARQARYAALQGQMRPGDLLFTGHHQDDQAETLLLQLLRGSGLPGLAAMPWLRPFGPGWLARPLLDLPRQALLDALRQRGLGWLEDPSNASPDFDRNYLRHHIMPLLNQRWPAAARCLSRSARHCAEAQDLLDKQAQVELGLSAVGPGSGGRQDQLEISALISRPLAERHWLLRAWLRRLAAPTPTSAQLHRLCTELLQAGAGRNPELIWGGVGVRRYRDRLYYLGRWPRPCPSPEPQDWAEPETLQLPGNGWLYLRPAASGLDPALWQRQRLQVRYRQGGERCSARHKSLKKLLQEAAIPPWQRDRLPLLFAGERLIAIANWGVCATDARSPGPGLELVWREAAAGQGPGTPLLPLGGRGPVGP